ncbi:hypothetical protein [Streptomyces sp. NPDC001985]|uniref:hypothetical protein n=1 Tax=Streptomyces sp. NPDC001985 TaxID=3154406 RepID=UPI003323D621
MYEYRLQELRRAELIQEAEAHRIARSIRRERRAAKRSGKDPEGPADGGPEQYARAA